MAELTVKGGFGQRSVNCASVLLVPFEPCQGVLGRRNRVAWPGSDSVAFTWIPGEDRFNPIQFECGIQLL